MAKGPNTRRFVLARDFVLASTLGHRVAFKSGEPIDIAAEIVPEAVAIGATPVQGEQPVTQENQNPTTHTGPDDVLERDAEITAAMKRLRESNARHDFTAAGRPKISALTRELGYDVDIKDAERLWLKLHEDEAAE